jgi:type II secretory ATPase GspE/PulE/Tfp pilus assembly ATPase PilB-like protein
LNEQRVIGNVTNRRISKAYIGFTTVVAALASATVGSEAQGQELSWPVYPLDGHRFLSGEYGRGPGGYLSLFSIVLLWLLFLVWLKIVDWVNRDTQLVGMSYAIWNSVVFFPFLLAFFLFGITVPYVGYFLTLLSVAVPTGVYIFLRNRKLAPHERVLTPDHFRHLFAGKAGKMGVKVDAEKKLDYQKGAPVELTAMGAADDQANQINLIKSRQSPGFLVAKEILADALDFRAERIMLDYAAQGVVVKYQLDGVWHDREPRDRESGDMALAVMKTIANLNAADRVQRQDGKFGAEYQGKKYVCQITSQGVQTGERVIVQLQSGTVAIKTIEDAGIRPKMLEQLKEVLSESSGFMLLSAMPAGGMSTTLNLLLKSLDRYMRDYYIVEEESKREPEVENVTRVEYSPAGGQTLVATLTSLFRKEPNVLVVPELSDPQAVGMLCEQAVEDSMVIGTIRAKEAAEALVRVLMLKVPAKQFAPVAKAVLNVRLIRKLCESCKQGYPPSPEVLQKLGIPAGKVQAFYQPPPVPENPKEICKVCNGIGYHGRTAVFELLVVDDKVRQALLQQPQLDTIKKLARAAGNRNLQDEGILLVAKGVTSLQELQRVLKQ